ncbi:NADH dehydrogenase [ubiquinone] 1 alpha subcomplex subunit 2-like [Ptychodera flava]|uniref:NADH dehydrogenase [ubiquinone] 1 alpha subcomplex subunit 2-like n=1 Tax=Ptychodera flava TaxID=63121 RepID=UPI00396AAB06
MASAVARRFPEFVRELRIHLCQRSGASQGVRNFIEQNYVPIKKQNPKFPILIRECSGIEPKMYARYERGREAQVSLSNMSSEQVAKALESLLKKS